MLALPQCFIEMNSIEENNLRKLQFSWDASKILQYKGSCGKKKILCKTVLGQFSLFQFFFQIKHQHNFFNCFNCFPHQTSAQKFNWNAFIMILCQ